MRSPRAGLGGIAELSQRVDQRIGFMFEVTDIAFAKGNRLQPWNVSAGDVRVVGTVKPIVLVELGFAAAELRVRRLRTQKISSTISDTGPPDHDGTL